MDKDRINRILLVISAISVIAFTVGTIVVNSFLSKYNIVDYDLLKPHAVTIGFTCLGIFTIHVFYYLLFIDVHNFSNKSIFKIIWLTVIKFFFITIMFFISFNGQEFFSTSNQVTIFGNEINLKFLLSIILSIPLLVMFNYTDPTDDKPTILDKLYSTLIILGIISCILEFIVFYNDPILKMICHFELLIGGYFIFSSLIIIDLRRYPSKKHFFTQNSLQKPSIFEYLFAIGCFAFAFLLLIFLYQNSLFPLIKQSFGGGKLEEISYQINTNDTISGKKIYETSDKIFLLEKDSTILKLEWKDIRKILNKK